MLSPSPSPKGLPCYIEPLAIAMAEAASPVFVVQRHSYNIGVKQFLDIEADVETPGLICSDRSEDSDSSSPMCGIGSN